MVVPLKPGKFYGSSLPRPRIYTDVKLNSDRVDPPISVMDPLLSWAEEAHWSMGGLSFKRLRLQGRIEGNVNKLRKFREKQAKLQTDYSPKNMKAVAPDGGNGKKVKNKKRAGSASPPPAPMLTKRRKFMDLFDEDESEGEEQQEVGEKVEVGLKKRPVRKLVGDFERVAKESEKLRVGDVVMKVVEEVNREGKKLRGGKKVKKLDGGESGSGGIRTSPRLAKQRSS